MKKIREIKIGWILPFVAGSVLFSLFLFFIAVCMIFEFPMEHKIVSCVLPVVLLLLCIWGARMQMEKKREEVIKAIEKEKEQENIQE